MIDLKIETLRTKNQARRLPYMKGRFGNAVSLATFERWCRNGIDGVILETVKIGGTVFTSEEAAIRFIERLNRLDERPSHSPTRTRAITHANKRLDDAGI